MVIKMWHIVDGKWRHIVQEIGIERIKYFTDGILVHKINPMTQKIQNIEIEGERCK